MTTRNASTKFRACSAANRSLRLRCRMCASCCERVPWARQQLARHGPHASKRTAASVDTLIQSLHAPADEVQKSTDFALDAESRDGAPPALEDLARSPQKHVGEGNLGFTQFLQKAL